MLYFHGDFICIKVHILFATQPEMLHVYHHQLSDFNSIWLNSRLCFWLISLLWLQKYKHSIVFPFLFCLFSLKIPLACSCFLDLTDFLYSISAHNLDDLHSFGIKDLSSNQYYPLSIRNDLWLTERSTILKTKQSVKPMRYPEHYCLLEVS